MGLCDDGLGLFQHFIPNIPKFHYSIIPFGNKKILPKEKNNSNKLPNFPDVNYFAR